MLDVTYDKITSKGWAIYRSDGEGPVKNLEINSDYMVLPKVTDESKIVTATAFMMQKQIYPFFWHNDDVYLIGSLSIIPDQVLVSSPAGEILLSQEEFNTDLDSLVSTIDDN